MTARKHKPRNFANRSAAVVVLNDNGVTLLDIAETLGVNPSSVTRQLNGERPLNGATAVAISDAIGPEEAQRLFAAIPARRRRRSTPTKQRVAREQVVTPTPTPTLFERLLAWLSPREATS